MIAVSHEIARWLLDEAKRDISNAFNSFAPHACKLCDEPTPEREWKSHLKAHRLELTKLARQRQRENTANLKRINRLRAEARHAR